MTNKAYVNHVALVLPDVELTANILKKYNFKVGAVDLFESMGTKEIYIESNKSASLLLMQPTKDGSYQRALKKRGPSLHHIAIDVLNLDQFINDISESGWLLHPNSLESIKDLRVAWVARPGFPALIEVTEVKEFSTTSEFVGGIKLSTTTENQRFVDALNLNHYVEITNDETQVLLDGQYFKISDLIK
jgi:hypothetical protein